LSLAEFNEAGDLPTGVRQAAMEEVTERFGSDTDQRRKVTKNLLRIYELASATGKLNRFLIFGSYVTAEPEPNDVDVVLVMEDDFNLTLLSTEERGSFDHQQADRRFGASIFWVRPGMLFEPLSQFVESWEIKRDGTKRGIVEVIL